MKLEHRLRLYKPRFVRFAKSKTHTHLGIIEGGWFRRYKPFRVY